MAQVAGAGRSDQITELRLREGLAELGLSGRQSLVGELAATIAHEISQPLGATFANTETLEVLLQSPASDLAELRKIAADPRYDSLRAVDVIRHLRKFLKRSTLELREVDLAEPVRDSIQSRGSAATPRGSAS